MNNHTVGDVDCMYAATFLERKDHIPVVWMKAESNDRLPDLGGCLSPLTPAFNV